MKIIVGTKVYLKQTILNLGTKLTQKGISLSKIEKANATIEFGIFELAWRPKFIWNKKF